jgi:hypothetical protein
VKRVIDLVKSDSENYKKVTQFKLVLCVICEECFCEKKILCIIFGMCDVMRLL